MDLASAVRHSGSATRSSTEAKRLPTVWALLACYPAAQRTRVWEALEPALDTQWGELGHRWSRLGPSRLPIEVSVASDTSTCRYTVEVAPPEVPDTLRLDIGRRRGEIKADSLLEASRTWQLHQTLRWGAWLGGRLDGVAHRKKLYVEIPRSSAGAAARFAFRNDGTTLPGTPVMVGIDADGSRHEWYCEPGRLDRVDVGNRIGRDALDVLDTLADRTWTPSDLALGVTVSSEGARTSVIVRASELLGSPTPMPVSSTELHYRKTLLCRAESLRLSLGRYGDLAAARVRGPSRTDVAAQHGLITISADPVVTISVGLHPRYVPIVRRRT
jgi:hypothetical protein